MAYSNVAPISALTARPWTRISRVPSITPTAWPGARVAGDRKEVRGGSGRQDGRPMLAARRFGVDLALELAELAEGGFGEQSSQLERVDPLQRAVIGLGFQARDGQLDEVSDSGELIHIEIL